VVVGAFLGVGAYWAQTGVIIAGIAAMILAAAIVAIIFWRISAGRTGETPWRAGPKL
jgi:hypothetical protein